MIIKKTKEERLIEVLEVRHKLKSLGYNNTHDEINGYLMFYLTMSLMVIITKINLLLMVMTK